MYNCKTGSVSHSRGLTIDLLFMEEIYWKVTSKSGENRELFKLAMLHTTGVSNGDEKLEEKQFKVFRTSLTSLASSIFIYPLEIISTPKF